MMRLSVRREKTRLSAEVQGDDYILTDEMLLILTTVSSLHCQQHAVVILLF